MNNDYYKKYVKYKIKYIELNKQIASGKKSSSKSSKSHKSSKFKKLFYKKKTMPTFLKKVLMVIKYGSEEVPILGEVEAFINVALSTVQFFNDLMSILNSKEVFKKLLKVNFIDGPHGVQNQYVEILGELPDEEKQIICTYLPQLFDKLKTNIEDWISTIPEAGPATVLAFEALNIISFNGFTEIFEGLPKEAQDLFKHPENLKKLMNKFIHHIYKSLGVKEIHSHVKKHHKGSGLIKFATSIASSQVKSYTKQGMDIADKQFNIASAPIILGLKAVGLDQLVVNKSIHYMNKVVNPSINVSIKALKIIFPLFYMALLANDDCKS